MSNAPKFTADWWERLAARGIIIVGYLLVLTLCLYAPLAINSLRQQKTLNVCAFTNIFSHEAIALFEERTGAKVNMTYAELDEEIGAKFSINQGEGYDVVNVSDFMVYHLAGQGYLHQLDHAKLRNKAALNRRLMGLIFDPHNTYSLPHKWFMYGIVYDKTFFKLAPNEMSLEYIFTNPIALCAQHKVSHPYRICMIDSPMDAYFLSMLRSFHRCDKFTDDQFLTIARALREQKSWVECYTLYTIEYFLLSGVVPLALTSSDFVRKIWDLSDRYEFAIPREGGILVIENLVIPKNSKNVDLAHEFIDFMLSDEVATLNSQTFGWTSANVLANKRLNDRYQTDNHVGYLRHLFPDDAIFNRLHIPLFSPYARKQADDAWLRVGYA